MRLDIPSRIHRENDPTHPLDPRKIFSRSFCSDPTEQTVRYSFDVRGFNLADYVLVPRSSLSFPTRLSVSPFLFLDPHSSAPILPCLSILIRWFIISTPRRQPAGECASLRVERGSGFIETVERSCRINTALLIKISATLPNCQVRHELSIVSRT